ncbi:DciA family protein [Candidatus Pelagibacter sp. HIMB1517]|uniref:DciA family protein n=1 Tax=Candidatus Pelagibacter sp. HIMB1517 TaxID=3413341 RepID=UPI003F8566AE
MKKNRSFSTLKPIHTLLPENLKKLIKNHPTSNYENLKKSWKKIVGENLSKKCELVKVQKYNSENSIFLKVDRNYLIDVDYSRDEIIEKVNSFLGFKFASKILINIKENKSPQGVKKGLKLNKKMENLIGSLNDEELKNKLKNFSNDKK